MQESGLTKIIPFICISAIWASLVAQLVKNPLAMREIWVRSLGWEDPLEKGKATHSSMLAWKIPWTIQSTKSQTQLNDFHFVFFKEILQYARTWINLKDIMLNEIIQ